jgi:N-acetylneuraminate lyase
MDNKLRGLIAATFTPMNSDGQINTQIIPDITEYLLNHSVDGLYVCGSTGEGPSLSVEERKQIAADYIKAVDKRIPVVVHVGHDSFIEAQALACHAETIGADAIASVGPSYFKPACLDVLTAYLAEIAKGAPNTDFYYYHAPLLNGFNMDMMGFIEKASAMIPTLKGVKYTALTVYEFQQCKEAYGDRYQIFFGCDEMLTSGLAAGADSAIGSSYNFAGKLYREIMDAFAKGDLATARKLQYIAIQMINICGKYGGHPGRKAIMKLVGLDCGQARLPMQFLTEEEILDIKSQLDKLGIFDWLK